MSEMIQVPCERCNEPMFIIPVAGMRSGICEACITKEHQRKTRARGDVDTRLKWEEFAANFKRYWNTDFYKLPCQSATGKALTWRYEDGTGLNLWGVPRTGKTRTLVMIAQREYDYKRTVRMFGPHDFALALAGFGFKADKWIARLRQNDLLCFDDIDKLKLTPVAEGHFFSLVENFIASKKPVIITHNCDATKLKAHFRNGEALVARLKDPFLFKSVHFDFKPADNAPSLPKSDKE